MILPGGGTPFLFHLQSSSAALLQLPADTGDCQSKNFSLSGECVVVTSEGLFFWFLSGSHYVTQAGLELAM
jgi:hypothetical protein